MGIINEETGLYEQETEQVSEFSESDGAAVSEQDQTVGSTEEVGFFRRQLAFQRQYNESASVVTDVYVRGKGLAGDADLVSEIPEEDLGHYEWCRTFEDVAVQTEKLNIERSDRKIIADSGLLESLSHGLIAALSSPMNVISARFAAAAMPAGPVAAAGVFAMTNIAMRYGSQSLMTAHDAAYEFVGALNFAAVGQMVGKLGSKIKNFFFDRRMRKMLQQDIADNIEYEATEGVAGRYSYVSGNEFSVKADGKVYKRSIKGLPLWFQCLYDSAPVGKCATSPFSTMNALGEIFFRVDYHTEATMMGISRGPSVEALKNAEAGKIVELKKLFHECFTEARKQKNVKLTDFAENVRLGMLYGRGTNEAEGKFVAAARAHVELRNKEAKIYGLSDVVDASAPMDQRYLTKAEAAAGDALESTLETLGAGSEPVYYFPRRWDADACVKNEKELIELLTLADMKQQYISGEAVNRRQAVKKAESQFLHIIGQEFTTDPTHERSVLIHDTLLDKFMIKDPIRILEGYERRMVPSIAKAKVLKEHGIKDMTDFRSMLDEEYLTMKSTTKDPAALREQYVESVRLLEDIPDLVDGTYSTKRSYKTSPRITSMVNNLRNMTYATQLGGMTLSALNDPMLLVNTYGLKSTVGTTLGHLKFLLGDTTKYSTAFKKDLNAMGVAIEMNALEYSNKLDGLAEMGWVDLPYRGMTRFTEKLAKMTTKWSGMAAWNDFWKGVAADMFTHKVLDTMARGKLTLKDKAFLAKSRLPEDMWERIKVSFEAHGEYYNDVAISNVRRWTDEKAREVFAAAVVTNSHNTVLLPGVGEIPVALRSLPGKFLVSFKSYAFSFTNNVLAEWACGRGTHKIATVTVGTGLSALGVMLKSVATGENLGPDDEELWARVGMKSEFFGWIFEPLKAVCSVGSGVAERGKYGAMTQIAKEIPNLGYLLDLADACVAYPLSREFDKRISERRLRSVCRLLPLYSVPYIKAMTNLGIHGYASVSGGKMIRRH